MAEGNKIFTDDSDRKTTERIIALLAGLFLLAAIAAGLLGFIDSLRFSIWADLWSRIVEFFLSIWPVWKIIAIILSLLSIIGIIYNMRKLHAINIEENKIFNPPVGASVSNNEPVAEIKNEKWEKVIKYANSNNPSDWRLAIIEADVILDELLKTLGYVGESIGDMLKSVDKSDFLSLDDAWEAHKVRNSIAHTGQNFELNERETKRVVGLFEKVFKEFEVI
jgi:hypothetical protein